MTRAIVSGRYANAVTRALAVAADIGVVVGGWAAGVRLLDVLLNYFLDRSVPRDQAWIAVGVFAFWAIMYAGLSTAIAGRTIGKALVGLRVVRSDGGPVGPGRSLVRATVFVVAAPIVLVSGALIILDRRHRSLHDLVAGTAVVYDWGDRPAELSAPLTAFLHQHDV